MKRILMALGLLVCMTAPSWAVCAVTNLQVKDNAAVTAAVPYADDGSGASNCSPQIQIKQGGHVANVTAAGAVQTDGSAVTQPVSAASLPLPTGAATSALQGTNSATTSHTCSTAGFSELGCLGQIDDDVKGPTTTFSAVSAASVTRPANTTTYTANTGWCGATAACATVFSFTGACRVNGGQVLIPEIDIWSSANPTLKLQGILWLFNATPGTIINDDATFNIASADFANLTGNMAGFPFTLTAPQASGAANSSVSLTGTTYHAQCPGGSTTLTGMVQVVNAYVPASNEVLHAILHTVGLN